MTSIRLSSRKHDRQAGFTLTELLVVIAIVGILATLLLVTLSGFRNEARSAQDVSNARQITLALMLCRDANRNEFPDIHQAGNINGWIEKLRDAFPDLRAKDMFASPMDNVSRKDPTKEIRSYAINDKAVNNFNSTRKNFFAPPNPARMILLANYGTSLSVIPGDGSPSTGCMDVFGSDTVSKFHNGGTGTTYGFFDGHVQIIKFDTTKQYWGSPWHNTHWVQSP